MRTVDAYRILKRCESDGAAVEGQRLEGPLAFVLVTTPFGLPLRSCDIASVLRLAFLPHCLTPALTVHESHQSVLRIGMAQVVVMAPAIQDVLHKVCMLQELAALPGSVFKRPCA